MRIILENIGNLSPQKKRNKDFDMALQRFRGLKPKEIISLKKISKYIKFKKDDFIQNVKLLKITKFYLYSSHVFETAMECSFFSPTITPL